MPSAASPPSPRRRPCRHDGHAAGRVPRRLPAHRPEEGEELGDAGDIVWFPDRTWSGRTYVPATTRTNNGFDLYGYVSFAPGDEREPSDLQAWADFTDETADRHPEWKMDICEEVVGGWRGEQGRVAAMTLVWGVPIVRGGFIATAELGGVTVDQARWSTIASRCWPRTPTSRTTSTSGSGTCAARSWPASRSTRTTRRRGRGRR